MNWTRSSLASGALAALALAGCGHAGPGAMEDVLPAAASGGAAAAVHAPALEPDAFDSPSPFSLREAQKAADNVPDGDIRHIVPGTDRENPPTPQPAFRDGPLRNDPAPAPPATADPAGHAGHGDSEEASLYVCPMHPEVTSDKPGTCPKCGMALVKKKS